MPQQETCHPYCWVQMWQCKGMTENGPIQIELRRCFLTGSTESACSTWEESPLKQVFPSTILINIAREHNSVTITSTQYIKQRELHMVLLTCVNKTPELLTAPDLESTNSSMHSDLFLVPDSTSAISPIDSDVASPVLPQVAKIPQALKNLLPNNKPGLKEQ